MTVPGHSLTAHTLGRNPALAEVFVLYEGAGKDDCSALRTRMLVGLASADLRPQATFSCLHSP